MAKRPFELPVIDLNGKSWRERVVNFFRSSTKKVVAIVGIGLAVWLALIVIDVGTFLYFYFSTSNVLQDYGVPQYPAKAVAVIFAAIVAYGAYTLLKYVIKRDKRWILGLAALMILWFGIMFVVSSPYRYTPFNTFSGQPEKYYRDQYNLIVPVHRGETKGPYGEEVQWFDEKSAKEYQRQQQGVTVNHALPVKGLDMDTPCWIFNGGPQNYILASSGSGLRLLIRRVEFLPNKTIADLQVEPGAGVDVLGESWVRISSGSEYARVFQSSLEYDGIDAGKRFRQITEPYKFRLYLGPVTNRGKMRLEYPGFQTFEFPGIYEGCPKQPAPPEPPPRIAAVPNPEPPPVVTRSEPPAKPSVETGKTKSDQAPPEPVNDIRFVNRYKPPSDSEANGGPGCLLYDGSENTGTGDSEGNWIWVPWIRVVDRRTIQVSVVVGGLNHQPSYLRFFVSNDRNPPRSDKFVVRSNGESTRYLLTVGLPDNYKLPVRFNLTYENLTYGWQPMNRSCSTT